MNTQNNRPAPKISGDAKAILNTMVGQITQFLDDTATPAAERGRNLFAFSYPFEAGENLMLRGYVMERNVRFDREDPEKLSRASCSIVFLEEGYEGPRYFATAYINPVGIAGVTVYEQDQQTGTVYRNTARWDNRPRN